MISVIMAAYNGEKHIREQLESVLSQTVQADEIIIGDDGSSDGTVSILKQLKSEACNKDIIDIYRNERNIGYAENFYSLMKRAKGDIVFFCDQDDIWKADKIEKTAEIFEKHTKVTALSTSYDIIDDIGAVIREKSGRGGLSAVSRSSFLRYPKYPGMAMAARGKLIKKAADMFSESGAAHDWAVNYMASGQDGMFFFDLPLVSYRRHEGNVSGMAAYDKDQRLQKRVRLIEELIRNLKAANDSDLEDMTAYQIKRLELMKAGRAVPLFLHDLLNLRHTSVRPVLGDLYAMMK